MKSKLRSLTTAVCGVILSLPLAGKADTSFIVNDTTADAFLSGVSPSLNYGSAGTVAIAPASSAKGEFDSIIKFNLAGAVSQFTTTYGAGDWQITGLTLSLASNSGTQGTQPGNAIFNTINAGSFGVDWLAYDGWTEGTGGGNGAANGAVSFSSISTLFSAGSNSLGTFIYTPPGNNVYLNYALPLAAGLVSDTAAGGDVSLYFYAADNQVGYLFNSKESASNRPGLTITAAPVPEPGMLALTAVSFGLLTLRKRMRTK
jgi:hypothetical protein